MASARVLRMGVALAALALVGLSAPAQDRLTASDLVYLGAFAYPPGTAGEWAYSGQALTCYPAGDPSGPPDGHPGSLFADGHDWDDMVGEISIPQPVVSNDFTTLPEATVLTPLEDLTGGWISGCNHAGTCPDCEFREVAGLAYLPNLDRVAWNLRDWYNVGGCDLDSLGWSRRDLGGAEGIWHVGPRPSVDNTYHNGKTCNLPAPERGRLRPGQPADLRDRKRGRAVGGDRGARVEGVPRPVPGRLRVGHDRGMVGHGAVRLRGPRRGCGRRPGRIAGRGSAPR